MNEMNLPVRDPGFRIPEEEIDRNAYAVSLIQAGMKLGVVSEKENGRFTEDVFNVLAETITICSGGESTSVKEATAERMLDSILFTIGAALGKEETPEQALLKLLDHGARAVWYDGLSVLNKMKQDAELLRLLLVRTRKPEQSSEYDCFIDIELKEYIEEYRPVDDARKELFIKIPDLSIKKKVHGLFEVVSVMRQMLDYNQNQSK